MECEQECVANPTKALRTNTATLGTLQQADLHDVEAIQLQIQEGLSLLRKDHDRITMPLADLSRTLVDNPARQFDVVQDAIAEIVDVALSPVWSQLEALRRELSEKTTRATVSGAALEPNTAGLRRANLESGSAEDAS